MVTRGMIITELIEGLPIELVRGPASTVIRDIVEDSRCAAPGCLFAARAGLSTDGRAHVGDAVARGATAILARDAGQLPDLPETVTALSADDVAHLVGILAERLHGRPGATLKLVGVTGTNGKTTVSHLIHHTLRRAGTRCGLMGTIHVDDGRQVEEADFTTPPATEISRRLAAMVRNGCTAAVMEVSSHALHQGRTAGLGFDVGVFTNLSGDHLDYHGTLGAYGESKAALLRSVPPTGWAVVNVDDPAATRMTDGCRAHVLSCSLTDAGAESQLRGPAPIAARASGSSRSPASTPGSRGRGGTSTFTCPWRAATTWPTRSRRRLRASRWASADRHCRTP